VGEKTVGASSAARVGGRVSKRHRARKWGGDPTVRGGKGFSPYPGEVGARVGAKRLPLTATDRRGLEPTGLEADDKSSWGSSLRERERGSRRERKEILHLLPHVRGEFGKVCHLRKNQSVMIIRKK